MRGQVASPTLSATRSGKWLHKEIRVTVLNRIPDAFRPHPRHAFWRCRCRSGSQPGIWPDGWRESWQNGFCAADEALDRMKFIDPDREIVHAARAVGATFGDGR